MPERRTKTAAELTPGMRILDEDHNEWVEVIDVHRRFRIVLVTIRPSTGTEETWWMPADRTVIVEED